MSDRWDFFKMAAIAYVVSSLLAILSGPSIRQWNYTGTPSFRIGIETGASKWLAANNAAAFTGDRDLLTSHFALFSLLCFLTVQEFDWQLRELTYRSK